VAAVTLPSKPRLRGWSHLVAAVAFPLLGLALVAVADGGGAKAATGVYTAGLTVMYGVSAAYHRGRWSPPVRRRMRRLDHSTILVGIAATYTPIMAIGVGGTTAKVMLGVVWFGALSGVAMRMLWFDAPRWIVAATYLGLGWVALLALPSMVGHLGAGTFLLVLLGGVVYSTGALVFARKRPDPLPTVFGYHEVFHALVLVAGALFYVAVARTVA
jgi:hemolysin III